METDSQALSRKFLTLSSLEKKQTWSTRGAGISLLAAMGLIFGGIGLDSVENIDSFYILLAFSIPITVTITFMLLSNRYILTKEQRYFFEFYKVHEILQTYLDVKTGSNKKNLKKNIYALSLYVGKWGKYGPSFLSEIPKSISSNLGEKIITIIENNEHEKITYFKGTLFDFASRISEKEPSNDDLKYLDESLKKIIPTIKPKSKEKEESFFQKYPRVKIAIYGITSGLILFAVLVFSELDWGQSLLGSVVVAVGVMTFFGMTFRRK